MKVTKKCDWIAVTFPFYRDVTFPEWVSKNRTDINAIKGYNAGFETTEGIRIYANTSRAGQGTHVVCSGSALAACSGTPEDLLKHFVESGANVRRIDLCVDVMDGVITPQMVTCRIKCGWHKSHAQKYPMISDALGIGYTQYIGKRTSESYSRVYDKAVEMGVDQTWMRIESVWQGDRGNPAAWEYLKSSNIIGMIKTHIDFPLWRGWQVVMNSAAQSIHVPTKETNTRYWLMSVVAKSLARAWAEDPDDQFYLQFIQRVRDEYLQFVEHVKDNSQE